MTIDPETLMAYADGELDAVSAKRVEKAVAADPALADQVERHRALRATLKDHFDRVAGEAVPDALAAKLRVPAQVVDLAAARRARQAPAPAASLTRRWWVAGGIAAALVVGLMLGPQLGGAGGDDFVAQGGRMVASGRVARALDGQLASNQPADAPVRMLVSFRNGEGAYCRAFDTGAHGGIACKEPAGWVIRTFLANTPAQAAAYRQAGSNEAALMADAQEMMAGAPLDARAELAAAAKGWR